MSLWVWASSGPSAEPSAAGPSAGPSAETHVDAKITLNVGVIARVCLIYATTLLLARLLGKLCAKRWGRTEPEQGKAPLLQEV